MYLPAADADATDESRDAAAPDERSATLMTKTVATVSARQIIGYLLR